MNLIETDDALEYVGRININGEMRVYHRTRIGAADEPRGYKVAYVVE